MIKIYTFNAAVLEDDTVFDQYLKDASPFRRRKIESLRTRRDKNLSLGATIAIDLGLRDYGLRERDMEYDKNPYGKPYFKDYPEIYFNVSHSAATALAAFSNRPVGCDIEKMREANLKVAERFFHAEEKKYILSLTDPAPAFWRLWTLKESFLKALGTGMGVPMNSFRISLQGDRAEVFQTVDEHEYSFYEYTKDNYRIAVCETLQRGNRTFPL